MNECNKCPKEHKKICESLCKMCGMAEVYANGNSPRREPIAHPDLLRVLPQDDYKSALSELREDTERRNLERLDEIRTIDSRIPTLCRKKCILAMILCGVTQREIEWFSSEPLSQSQISRIARVQIVLVK